MMPLLCTALHCFAPDLRSIALVLCCFAGVSKTPAEAKRKAAGAMSTMRHAGGRVARRAGAVSQGGIAGVGPKTRSTRDRAPLKLSCGTPPFNQEFPTNRRTNAVKQAAAPKPPEHLKPPTRKWFAGVVADYALEDHHVRLLTLAAEAWDRAQQAREALATGLTFNDRFGAPHARPEVAIERDSRTAFARLIRELDLDVEAPPAGVRPPAIRSNRRN
jgi:phage terminase small subunit